MDYGKGKKKNYVKTYQYERHERHQSSRKFSQQCHECQGFGHYKADCPTARKREVKCEECKGFGHIVSECVNLLLKKNKANIGLVESDSSSEDEDSNEVTGYCAFTVIIEEEKSEDECRSTKEGEASESETDDEEEFDMKAEYKKLYHSWLGLGETNVSLVEEKLKLQEINSRLQDALTEEQEKRRLAEHELNETKKQVKMLNSGTKDLEKILSYGRVGKINDGLGYEGVTKTEKTVWVAGTTSGLLEQHQEEKTELDLNKDGRTGKSKSGLGYQRGKVADMNTFVPGKSCWNKSAAVPAQKIAYGNQFYGRKECYYCGHVGHIKRYCYKFSNKVKRLLKLGKFFPNKKKTWQVWMAKDDLYPTSRAQGHVAFSTTVSTNDMTGNQKEDSLNTRSTSRQFNEERVKSF